LDAFSVDQIRAAVSANLDRTEKENTTWLAEYVKRNSKNGRCHYEIDGKPVCRLAFLAFNHFSKNKLERAKTLVTAGSRLPVHFNVGGLREDSGCSFTSGFLAVLFDSECDKLVSGNWILPGYLDVAEITSELRKSWSSKVVDVRPPRCPSDSLVRQVMRKDFPNVVSPLGPEWGMCNTCLDQRAEAKRGAKTEQRKTELENEIKEHRKHHKAERTLLEQRNALTEAHPERYTQLLIDMTRSAWLPHLVQMPKVWVRFACVP
jgi:hypothetical protein